MKTILITGVSSGLGKAMAEAALKRGHRVLGTLRNENQRQDFERSHPGQAIGRLLDVTDTPAIRGVVDAFEAEQGAIDVLINNAGYGLRGVVEELELDALRKQFEVNVFAPVALMQAVLPKMRERRAGQIINVSSMGGVVTFPGLGAYHGSKFAILGLSDTIAQEVAGLGIHVTSILPGMFQTNWNGRSQEHVEHVITEYNALLNQKHDLKWAGSAVLGEIVADLIENEAPPRRLLIGKTAVTMIREEWKKEAEELDRWQEISNAGGQG